MQTTRKAFASGLSQRVDKVDTLADIEKRRYILRNRFRRRTMVRQRTIS